MSEVKVNKISPRTNCGTVQLGDSGDTITIPAGATIVNNGTQTGFGRTGTVDWDTTAKTASFTAVSGNGYFVNTTSGAITVTLPASPSAGDIVYVKDYAGTATTNAITVARNGSNIRGEASDFTFDKNNSGGVFIYVDATEGWQVFVDGSNVDAQSTFITATGGTITCCGDYKIHTFTGPGTFCVSQISCFPDNNEVSYMVVAGGGGGGSGTPGSSWGGGGGGAGGFRESKSGVDCYSASPIEGSTPITVTATAFPITVGGGGAGGPVSATASGKGSNSVFSTITSTGGGGGGSGRWTCAVPYPNAATAPQPGGSGGGGVVSLNTQQSGGTGNTPPVSPSQGNTGGTSGSSPNFASGGGGGAGAAGGNSPCGSPTSPGGTGGNGVATSISGSSVTRAGGAAGSGFAGCGETSGGSGGGVPAPNIAASTGAAAPANTGSGGGAGGGASGGGPGGAGGSGIVIIRYKYQ